MTMKDGFELLDEIKIPSNFGAVNQVELLVDKVCSTLGVEEDHFGNVLIAVTEAVNNAIIHGNVESSDLNVEIEVGSKEGNFYFNVKDQGRGFDYNNLPDPTAPENLEKENGRGIYLMKHLADNVEFEDYGRSVFIYFNR